MNALKILFMIAFGLYMLIYEIGFWKYYFGILIPYYLITQVFFFNSKFNTLKKKVFISMWGQPYDPMVIGTMKLNINNLQVYLQEYSKKVGIKIGLTCFITKVGSLILKKFKSINGNVALGKV